MHIKRYRDQISKNQNLYHKIRNSLTLEYFNNENFLEVTNFTHDGWSRYSFLNDNMNYSNDVHNHHWSNQFVLYIIPLPILKIMYQLERNHLYLFINSIPKKYSVIFLIMSIKIQFTKEKQWRKNKYNNKSF